MRRSLVPACIVLATALCLFWGARLFWHDEAERYRRVRALEQQPSVIRLALTINYARGEIAREEYRMADLNGLSSASYRVTGRSGTVVRVEGLPYVTYDVAAFFGQAVQDGVWELRDAPPRGDTSVNYAVSVEQSVDGKHGAHVFHFTDPHYWATTAGRQYHLRLDKNKPVPDMLFLNGISIAQPRYERVVHDFLTFGSGAFQEKAAAARLRVCVTRTACR